MPVTSADQFEEIIVNGLNATSGQYSLPPIKPAVISAVARGLSLEEAELQDITDKKNSQDAHFGVNANARNLNETGWGVIFPTDIDPAVVEALQPLLNWRKSQAGERFKVYAGVQGVRAGESKTEFLERHGVGFGPVDPEKVPYYLLLVGSPQEISFAFQQQIDVQYASGRLYFETPADYASYAASVLLAERGLKLAPRMTFFATANPDDQATNLSADHLVTPLADRLMKSQTAWLEKTRGPILPAWKIDTVLKERATKQALADLLNHDQAPALLFSASHGLDFNAGDPRQLDQQGALVTQDWQGPLIHRGPIPEDLYFAAQDLDLHANLLGSMVFLFACFGAGTPQVDEFAGQVWKDDVSRKTIAPYDFVAALPRRMLSLARGGALAVVGHVDRTWGSSFMWGSAGAQLKAFEDCFTYLMRDGYPIGYAMEGFNVRYAELSTELTYQLEQIKKFFKKVNDRELARLWTGNNDARNYIVLGDPAVRLAVGGEDEAKTVRPELTLESAATSKPKKEVEEPDQQAVSFTASRAEQALSVVPENIQESAAPVNELTELVKRLNTALSRGDFQSPYTISTYTSDDLTAVRFEHEQNHTKVHGAQLAILTHLISGKEAQLVMNPGQAQTNPELLQAHLELVNLIQSHHTTWLQTMENIASDLAISLEILDKTVKFIGEIT